MNRVGDIVIFDVLGAAPRSSGATEAAAHEEVHRIAETLKAPYEDFNGEALRRAQKTFEAGYKANRHNAAALAREKHIRTRVG